jgi:hypothetical protein
MGGERQRFGDAAPNPGQMSRPVPEAAPLVGLVLAFAFALFGFLFSANHLATVLVSLVLLYPFVAFGIVRSASAETVFLPDPILAAGFLGGSLVALYGLATGQVGFGLLVAVVVAGPPVIYHARFGDPVNPISPDATLVVGLLAAVAVLSYGALGDLLVGSVTAILVGFTSVDYRRQRGGPLERRTRSVALVCCLGGGLAAFGLLAAVGRPSRGLAAGSVLVALGAFLALGASD